MNVHMEDREEDENESSKRGVEESGVEGENEEVRENEEERENEGERENQRPEENGREGENGVLEKKGREDDEQKKRKAVKVH